MPCLTYNKLLPAAIMCISLSACISMPGLTTSPQAVTAAEKPKMLVPQGYNEAIRLAKAAQYDDAIKLFADITRTAPDFTNGWTNLGLLYRQTGDKKQAEAAFRQALILNDKDAVSYNHLGILMREQGNFAEAVKMYEQAINCKPDYAIAVLNLGILYDLYLQDLPRALSQYHSYQQLTGNQDKTVEKWIIDLDTRIKAKEKSQS